MTNVEDITDIDPLLSMDQVTQLVPLSSGHIHRLLKAKRFPARVRLGYGPRSRIAFRKSEIIRYLECPTQYYSDGFDDLPDSADEAF